MEYSDMLYHLSCQYIKDKVVAEEIVLDAFVKLWEVKSGLKEELSLRNYLYTIVKNNCLMHLRKEQLVSSTQKELRYLEMQLNYDALFALADNVVLFDELQERIDAAIEGLPEYLKTAFLLSRFVELKYSEIAAKKNISIKTVEARIFKSLVVLRTELKEYLPLIYLITSIFS